MTRARPPWLLWTAAMIGVLVALAIEALMLALIAAWRLVGMSD